jgi:Bacterial CdiA-CT RNAse A domain
MINTSDPVREALSRPMPGADAAMVRLVATRAAGVAAELRRAHAALAGSMGSTAGWSGPAELAFQDSMTAQLSRLAPAVQRCEGYATALSGYARELDWLQPQLLAARSRLSALPQPTAVSPAPTAVPSGVAGFSYLAAGFPQVSAGSPGLTADGAACAAEFERLWLAWDGVRGRCVAGLAVAGAAGADRRRGWWGWVSELPGVRSVRLADVSRVLGDLGQALVAAGVILTFVCPPAAGAVWAAVAVVAVCQLVVDGARRERGERVGLAGLGWDAAGMVPMGRLAAGMRSAGEASAAIERLAPHLRFSRIVPGGGLAAHEGTASYRGHTLLKHVGKTSAQLAARFPNEPDLHWSSSFDERGVAEETIAKLLHDHTSVIKAWLASPHKVLAINVDVGTEVGTSLHSDGTLIRASKIRVVLRRENTVLGYYIKSAFPTP